MTRDEIDDYALDAAARSVGSEYLGDMLCELAEDICHGTRPLTDTVFGMAHTTEDDLLSVDPFDGDFGEGTVLSDRMVVGRKVYSCFFTGQAIEKGERHRCLTERYEGILKTFRFSLPALWLASQGADPTMLRPSMAPQGEPSFGWLAP